MKENVSGNPLHQEQLLNSALKVLLVDDNKVNQFLGKRILSNLGIQHIEIASSGNEAFEKTQQLQFDVMLTDVEMPGMNGYELSHKIRTEEKDGNRLTIIALTANASDDDREHARLAGIDDYLTKPYSPQDLFDILSKNTVLRQGFFMNNIQEDKITGIAKLYAVFNHNENDVTHFLKMLSQQLPELIADLKLGLAEQNSEKAYHAAHKLKSPVKLLTLNNYSISFGEFTESLRSQYDFHLASTQFIVLESELNALLFTINIELEKN